MSVDPKRLLGKLLGKPDPLNAQSPPAGSGGRRLNNVPLYLVGAVVVGFILVCVYTMAQRDRMARDAVKPNKPQHNTGADQAAKNVTSPWMGTSFINAANQPKLEEIAPPPPEPIVAASAPTISPPSLPPPPPARQEPPPLPDELSRFREKARDERFAALASAVRSPSALQKVSGGTGLSGGSGVTAGSRGNGPGNASHSYAGPGNADPFSIYQQQYQRIRQMVEESGVDTSGADMAPVAGVSGTGEMAAPMASGSAPSGNEYSKYAHGGSWTLNSRMELPVSPFTLQAGFVLPAMMISGINSDLPGQVMAQVSQNVYDSPTGKYLLIPQGTRLVGTYNSGIAYGQSRVLMAWQRLIFPDGRTLDIGAMPGADHAGYAGFHDKVNNHYIRLFSSAILLSGVIAAVDLSQDESRSDNSNSSQRASDALSEALGQTLGQVLAELFRKNLSIAPTLEIRPGYKFNVMVVRDMVFNEPYVTRRF